MDKCEFLYGSFRPPDLEKPPSVIDSVCAMTGRKISTGYRVDFLVTQATSQPHEIFRYPSEWCSVEAARLFKSMRGPAAMIANLFASSTGGAKPLISMESATAQNRPCWRDIIETLPVGIPTVAVFTEESKRRFWLDAPLCVTGSAWRPYLHWRNVSRVLTVDVLKLQSLLVTVERIYSYGFSKDAIINGLFDNFQQVQKFGYPATTKLEQELLQYRDSDEMLLATFVAQKVPAIVAQYDVKPTKQQKGITTVCKTSLETPQPIIDPSGQIRLF